MSSQRSPKENPWKERWEALGPETKKRIVLFGAIAGIFLLVFMMISVRNTPVAQKKAAQAKIQNVLLPDDNTGALGVAGVSSDMKTMRSEVRALSNDLQNLRNQMNQNQTPDGSGGTSNRLLAELEDAKTQIADLKRAMSEKGATPNASVPSRVSPQLGRLPPGTLAPSSGSGEEAAGAAAADFGGIRTISPEGSPSSGATNEAPTSGPAMASSTPPSTNADKRAETIKRNDSSELILTSGSFVRAVLYTGADVATGRSAVKSPIPVLAVITDKAFLPNNHRADFRGCFVLLDAIGDLASERAKMRTVSLSCVRKDRGVIDVPIEGFVLGEDGREGVKGRLVSKQGKVLRSAGIAGLAQGISQAFGGNNLGIGGPGSTNGQIDPGQLRMGALGGSSSALDRIADYYLDLADELHPVIEVGPLRRVTIAMIRPKVVTAMADSNIANRNLKQLN